MDYIALYRKWRSQRFSEVVGQDHIVRALSNAIKMGWISHAYLFSGPRGTGKTTVARIFAKSLNCVNGPTVEPCNICDQCVSIQQGNSLDVVELDAASNRGIDEIRSLREQTRFVPIGGRYSVFIIDEAHMLTQEAFNALLKT
ncbi:MAG TPA: AAA family ATPase, partial [bacterium]|nr:AAA family ATPase [bacterium]